MKNALKHGLNGTFTWRSWAVDVGVAAATSLITTGTSMLNVWQTTTTFMLFKKEIAQDVLENAVRTVTITSFLIGGLSSAASNAIAKVVKAENINPVMLVMAFVAGGIQGNDVSPSVIEKTITGNIEGIIKDPHHLR